MSTKTTDRIQKQVLLRAPRSRVWRAITEAEDLRAWTQSVPDQPLAPGILIHSRFLIPGAEHLRVQFRIERMEPETLLSWRWHPNDVDPAVDRSSEPTTLVEFRLEDAEGGTLLTVTESGFDAIPLERRAEALQNEQGWEGMLAELAKHIQNQP